MTHTGMKQEEIKT